MKEKCTQDQRDGHGMERLHYDQGERQFWNNFECSMLESGLVPACLPWISQIGADCSQCLVQVGRCLLDLESD